MVKGRIDHTGQHALADPRPQHGVAGSAGDTQPIAIANAAQFGIGRVQFQQVFLVPFQVVGASRLRPHVVLAQDPAGGQQQRESSGAALVGRHIMGDRKLTLANREVLDVHGRGARGMGLVAGPLNAAQTIQLVIADPVKAGGQLRDLVHDFAGVLVVHRIAQGLGQGLGYLPIGHSRDRRHDLADPVDAAFGVGKGPVLLQKG